MFVWVPFLFWTFPVDQLCRSCSCRRTAVCKSGTHAFIIIQWNLCRGGLSHPHILYWAFSLPVRERMLWGLATQDFVQRILAVTACSCMYVVSAWLPSILYRGFSLLLPVRVRMLWVTGYPTFCTEGSRCVFHPQLSSRGEVETAVTLVLIYDV